MGGLMEAGEVASKIPKRGANVTKILFVRVHNYWWES